MPTAVEPLPARRADLRIEPFGAGREHVVKDTRSGDFFLLGEQEHFLLLQLDGRTSAAATRAAFERRFATPLQAEDLASFVEMAGDAGILASQAAPPPPRQSILFWRKRLWNPDRFLERVEPRLRWLWTRGFLLISAAAILAGMVVLWSNREQLSQSLHRAVHGDLLLGWFVLCAVGVLHETAHGLTCKHHGGEVREMGFLFLLFIPCFYCNVSDAWLFRDKRKRLWVMLAGGYCDLIVWALAVFVWRVAEPGTLCHRVSFLVMGVSGLDSLFNFNPLLKFDGYYMLSDWQDVPNLRQRAFARLNEHACRWLWGAPQPEPEPRDRFLTGFGIASCAFSMSLLATTLVLSAEWLRGLIGAPGYLVAAALIVPPAFGLIPGIAAGEVWKMVTKRRLRGIAWLVGLAGAGAALCLVHVEEFSGGTFRVRPTVREDIRSPVAGFLREVLVDEGDRVPAGGLIARLEVPDLDCRLAQKRAELREARAQLLLLETGTRPEEIAEQCSRVERAARWRDQARHDLARMQQTLEQELAVLSERLAEADLECAGAEADAARIQSLRDAAIASHEQQQKAEQARDVARVRRSLAASERRAREARGTILAEEALARRELDLSEERAKLTLMKAGTRPEEIDGHRARIDRLDVETRYLEGLLAKLEIRSTVEGVVVTPRVREKTGGYLREGEPICLVEGQACREAEVYLEEGKLRGVEPGQSVRFKARALPFETIEGRVTGIASCAAVGDPAAQGSVVVHCSMDGVSPVLRTSMSGHARIYTGRRAVGAIALDWAMRLLRTEFWW